MSRSGFNFNNLRNLFIIEVARKYFEETSIHGLKYITEPNRTLVERVCWLIFITVSCCVAGYLIYSVCGNMGTVLICYICTCRMVHMGHHVSNKHTELG